MFYFRKKMVSGGLVLVALTFILFGLLHHTKASAQDTVETITNTATAVQIIFNPAAAITSVVIDSYMENPAKALEEAENVKKTLVKQGDHRRTTDYLVALTEKQIKIAREINASPPPSSTRLTQLKSQQAVILPLISSAIKAVEETAPKVDSAGNPLPTTDGNTKYRQIRDTLLEKIRKVEGAEKSGDKTKIAAAKKDLEDTRTKYRVDASREVAATTPATKSNSGDDKLSWIFKRITTLFGSIATGIFGLFRLILSVLLTIVGVLYDYFFKLEELVGYTKNEVVRIVWEFIRNIANIIIAIALLIIAFTTILYGIDANYGVKRALPTLILVAILLNFSLVLSGIFIDASQVFLRYMVDDLKGTKTDASGGRNVSLTLASQLGRLETKFQTSLGETFEKKLKSQASGLKKVGDFVFGLLVSVIIPIISGIMSLIFLIAAIFAFIVGFFLLFTRMLKLWGLIVFAPLAILSMALPKQFNQFGKWFGEFTNACLVGPAYMIFLWAAMVLIGIPAGSASSASVLEGIGQMAGATTDPLISMAVVILQYSILIAILLGGAKAAQQFGDEGAKAVLSTAEKYKGGATNWAKGVAQRRGVEARRAVGARITSGQAYQKTAGWLASRPATGAIGRAMQTTAGGVAANRKKEIETEQKRYENLTNDQLRENLKHPSPLDPKSTTAQLQVLAKRDKLSELSTAELQKLTGAAKHYGVEKDILKKRPDAAGNTLAEIQTYVDKMSAADIAKMDGSAFTDPHVQQALNNRLTAAPGSTNALPARDFAKFAQNNPKALADIQNFVKTNASAFKANTTNPGLVQDLAKYKHDFGFRDTRDEIIRREVKRDVEARKEDLQREKKEAYNTQVKSDIDTYLSDSLKGIVAGNFQTQVDNIVKGIDTSHGITNFTSLSADQKKVRAEEYVKNIYQADATVYARIKDVSTKTGVAFTGTHDTASYNTYLQANDRGTGGLGATPLTDTQLKDRALREHQREHKAKIHQAQGTHLKGEAEQRLNTGAAFDTTDQIAYATAIDL